MHRNLLPQQQAITSSDRWEADPVSRSPLTPPQSIRAGIWIVRQIGDIHRGWTGGRVSTRIWVLARAVHVALLARRLPSFPFGFHIEP